MSEILITGAEGFIGSHLMKYYGYRASALKSNITDTQAVKQEVEVINPSVIIHCAALKDVRWCEEHQLETMKTNVYGTQYLGCLTGPASKDLPPKKDMKFIFLSSDMVFSGKKGNYDPTDHPDPTTVYGQSKYEAERFTEQLFDYAIVRTSAVYGHTKSNIFVNWLISELEQGHEVEVFDNYINSPTYVWNLCEMIDRVTNIKYCHDTYHLAGSERISKYDFAIKLAEVFGYNKKLIKPIQYKEKVDISLGVLAEQHALEIDFNDVETGLKRMWKDGGN